MSIPTSEVYSNKCAFCEGTSASGIFDFNLVVPRTGGNTCGSIKLMVASESNRSEICKTLQKEEGVCCPQSPSVRLHDESVMVEKRAVMTFDDGNMTTSHPSILYGHVHIAKTGGTSLNGILANTFERVCGHKGYSYDAFQENERAKILEKEGKGTYPKGRSRVFDPIMKEIGFEDCDYISHEAGWQFWSDTFGSGKFHGLTMELHVPCRNRIDHLMSQCNSKHKEIACDAATDEELFQSVKNCYEHLYRYAHDLQKDFKVRCFDFKKQFNDYQEYMSGILQKRRFQSTPYVKRETNVPRNQTNECIWGNATVLEKVEKYLLETVTYYQFCDQCMGSENEITLQQS